MDLVVGASNDAVKSLVNKLGSLLAQEYTLIRGARDDIQYITDELGSMQAFLNRLKRAPGSHDEQRLDWMKQVREVSYDIEDCVDDVDHRLSGEPRGSGILVFLRKKWYLLTTLSAPAAGPRQAGRRRQAQDADGAPRPRPECRTPRRQARSARGPGWTHVLNCLQLMHAARQHASNQ